MAETFFGSENGKALALKSYEEVLDATKHQDDKIGRFLTAIAFLFTGAIAFGARSDLLAVRVQIDDRLEPLPALFLALFLVLSIVSVLLLIVAIGPNLSLPRGSSGERIPSWLFFLWIAGKSREEWVDQWKEVPLPGAVARSFVVEAHNLALKTEFKYNRTNEARAIFTLGLMFLALAIVLFFEASVGEGAFQPLAWDFEVRLFSALVIAVFAVILVYDQLRLSQDFSDYATPGKRVGLVWPWMALVVAGPLYVLSLVLFFSNGAVAIAGAVTAIGLAHLAVWLRRQGRDIRWPDVAHSLLLLIIFASVFVVAIDSEFWALWLCIAVVVLLEIPRLSVATLKLHQRLAKMRSSGESLFGGLREEWRAYTADARIEKDRKETGVE